MFQYATHQALKEACDALGVTLPWSEDTSLLGEGFDACGRHFANRMVIQPMEGCDGTPEGAPGEQTVARYDRFADTGAGLIWMEACAVQEDGRANPRQLWITERNVDAFARLADRIRARSQKTWGRAPVLLLQITHSGRYAKPHGTPEPLIAYNNPLFEGQKPIDRSRILSDDALKRLEENMAAAAALAERAGFDGVDVKCCHRYLASELLSAYERPGEYGGSFENRTRFVRNAYKGVRAATSGGFLAASRMNLYDGFPWPLGFGVSPAGGVEPELSEAVRLVGLLREEGLGLLNATIGNPYFNPHVNRPADQQTYPLTEDPLVGVERILNCARTIQSAYPSLTVVGSGATYLRQYQPGVFAGGIRDGYFRMAGFGRQAFAYPELIAGILRGEAPNPKKCCITCGKCTRLMRLGTISGCVIRNPYYTELFREKSAEAK